MQLNNIKTALITGASKRIGASIANYLHQKGFNVLIHCYQSQDEAQLLSDSLNLKRKNSAHVLTYDLSVKESAENLICNTIALFGRLDVLVNNASIFSRHEEDWDKMFVTNVKSPFWLSYAAYPYLFKTQGIIINITDTHADAPLKSYSMYCQTKASLVMQTKSLAIDFAPSVRVNSVAPGAIEWPQGDNTLNYKQQQKIISKTPLQRHGDPLFIALAVYSLIVNPFITGQTIRVDGGRNLT